MLWLENHLDESRRWRVGEQGRRCWSLLKRGEDEIGIRKALRVAVSTNVAGEEDGIDLSRRGDV